MLEERDCEHCQNYKMGDSGYRSCCKWNCQYEPVDGSRNENLGDSDED